MLLNPGNPLTPFSSSQQPERLEILSCGISEPGVLSYCLTPWAIFSPLPIRRTHPRCRLAPIAAAAAAALSTCIDHLLFPFSLLAGAERSGQRASPWQPRSSRAPGGNSLGAPCSGCPLRSAVSFSLPGRRRRRRRTSCPGWEVEQRQPPPPPERERQEKSRLGNPKVPATLHRRLPSSFMGKVWKQQMYPQYATYYYPQYLQAKVKGCQG